MTLKTNFITRSIAILSLLIMCSCGTRKELVYFQDEPLSDQFSPHQEFELTYKTNDILTIDVSALDPDAVRPFNLAIVNYGVTNNVVNSNIGLNANANQLRQTYLVDVNGNIEFPVIGTIKIGGMTRIEVTEMLKERISEYVKDPIVNVRLINFTVTVLGEVNRPGTYTIQDERISMTEALGLAGDLTIYGKRNNVFLIREIDGQKKYAKYDLTSISVVNSPVYYLSQNDVIYVEPNEARIKSSSFNPNTAVVISAISTLATIAAIFIVR